MVDCIGKSKRTPHEVSNTPDIPSPTPILAHSFPTSSTDPTLKTLSHNSVASLNSLEHLPAGFADSENSCSYASLSSSPQSTHSTIQNQSNLKRKVKSRSSLSDSRAHSRKRIESPSNPENNLTISPNQSSIPPYIGDVSNISALRNTGSELDIEESDPDYAYHSSDSGSHMDNPRILKPFPAQKTPQDFSSLEDFNKKSIRKDIRIAIIGAGISGISAARRLKDNGFSPTIFEGRNRIGGRIHSLECHAVKGLDVGASWIYGINDNPIYEICLKHNLATHPNPTHNAGANPIYLSDEQNCLYDANGEKFDEYFYHWAHHVHQKHLNDAADHGRSLGIEQSLLHSLGPFMEEKLREVSKNDPRRRKILNWHLSNVELNTGAHINSLALSALDQSEVKPFRGPNVMVPDGFQKVLELEAADLDIRMEHVVQKIQYTEESTTIFFLNSPVPQTFDYCILTTPLGVLKASIECGNTPHSNIDQTYFHPQSSKTSSLAWHENLCPTPSFETIPVPPHTFPNFAHENPNSNCYIQSTQRAKLHASNMVGCIRFEPELPDWKISAIKQMGFGCINKIALVFPHIFWDTTKTYIGWASEIRGQYSQIHFLHPKPALLILLSGTFSSESESREAPELIAEAMAVLSSIHGPISPPLYASITRWGSDPFCRGSYSYLPTGMLIRDYDSLSFPVKDRLLFAGEHTMSAYPSTAHGAYLSGKREADRIINLVTGRLEREAAFKWFIGEYNKIYSVTLNQYDGFQEYEEEVLQGPNNEERKGWFSKIRCAFCNKIQTPARPFCGFVNFIDSFNIHRRFAVHKECCYFTPEIVSNVDGTRWFNISRALKRSTNVFCMICGNPGASISCSHIGCENSFHVNCALENLHWPCYLYENRAEALYCNFHSPRMVLTQSAYLQDPYYLDLQYACITIAKFMDAYKNKKLSSGALLTHTHGKNNKRKKRSADGSYIEGNSSRTTFQVIMFHPINPHCREEITFSYDRRSMICSIRQQIENSYKLDSGT